jgi:enoyl-CoA hydratase/carnithine racemase
VTVADVAGDLVGPALEVALCCDLVYLRQGVQLGLPAPEEAPPAGLLWALARAGRPALARGLLGAATVAAEEAVAVGLAHAVVARERPLPLPQSRSVSALTAARDLMRTRSPRSSALQLELATFQLLFATAHPQEGARAFLDDREPRFEG